MIVGIAKEGLAVQSGHEVLIFMHYAFLTHLDAEDFCNRVQKKLDNSEHRSTELVVLPRLVVKGNHRD